MKHRFSQTGELDCPLAVAVAAYLDCEHYVFLHQDLTDRVEVLRHQGLSVTVRQSWRAWGLKIGHIKTGTWLPPNEFHMKVEGASPWWMPSFHHIVGIETHLTYWKIPERDATGFLFAVELDIPFWMRPLAGVLERLIKMMHDQQNFEDLALIKRRERLFGRGNLSAYLVGHHFMYHKDEFSSHFKSVAARP